MVIAKFYSSWILALSLLIFYPAFTRAAATVFYKPVKIISLTAKYVPESKAVNIHWISAGEKEQVQYIIERSLDSLHFRMIGETRSNGSSQGQQHYYYYDPEPVGGTMYYRIREIDAEGKQFVTQVVEVNTPISGMAFAQLMLADNGKELNFAIISPDSSRSNVLVSDVAGNIEASFVLDLKRGANMHSIYTGNLPPGVYFLQINDQDGANSVMEKFVKKAVMRKPKMDSSSRQLQ